MNHKEDDEQAALFEWAAYQRYDNQPLTDFMWANPMGGKRNAREAARLKRQGVKAGVFDIFMAIPLRGDFGLFIEMKVGDNSLSAEQEKFKNDMTRKGYLCVICYSFDDANMEIENYILLCRKGIPAGITEIEGDHPYLAHCRRMSVEFKTRRGAIGWLRRRGFDEDGNRIYLSNYCAVTLKNS